MAPPLKGLLGQAFKTPFKTVELDERLEVDETTTPSETETEETPQSPKRRRGPPRRLSRDARELARRDPTAPGQLLEQKIRGNLKPKAVPPGQEPPSTDLNQLFKGQGPVQGQGQGQGGKGGIFSPASAERADAALKAEPEPDPKHPYVQHKTKVQGQLEKLDIMGEGKDRIHVDDPNRDHGGMVVRTLGGKTGLARGAEISLDSPDMSMEEQMKARSAARSEDAGLKGNPSVDDFVKSEVAGLPNAVDGVTSSLAQDRIGLMQKVGPPVDGRPPDGKKTFVNLSWGETPDEKSGFIAANMLLAKKGTKLHQEATAALGHEPTVTETLTETGEKRYRLERDELNKLKSDVIYPKMKAEMAAPQFQERMSTAKTNLETELAEGRKAGILVFNSAGNDHARAEAAGDPEMSRSMTDGVKGLVRVGATKINGPGFNDDEVAGLSSDGKITVSAPGVGIPVGVKDGKAVDVNGTSFSSPIAVETAYAMSRANPDLSVNDIERLIQDPRAVHDIAGTTRDGAGEIDQFAAVVLAQNPRLTRNQIEQARSVVDGNPTTTQIATLKSQLGLN